MKSFSLFLEKNFGIRFKEPSILVQALTHRSYIRENAISDLEDNEKLEFLGDSFLNFVITFHIYKKYKDFSEGELAKLKAYLTSAEVLYEIGVSKLGLSKYILLGKGEEKTGGRNKKNIIADALEALIGAYLIDSGYSKAKRFVLSLFKDYIDSFRSYIVSFDPKTEVQVLVQKIYKETPKYTLLLESGEEHNKRFISALTVGARFVSIGRGRSKKEAEKSAARRFLSSLVATDESL